MELVVDHQRTYLSGHFPREILDPITSYKVDGYFFAASYKKGHWDGCKRFIKYDQSKKQYYFGTGFLQRITQALDNANFPYHLYDERVYEDISPTYVLLPGVDLRAGAYSYQAECLDAMLSHGRGILKLGTGGGKTEIGAALIKSIGKRTVWLTHRLNLLHQTRKRLRTRLGEEIGIIGDGECDIKPITVAMVQTLAQEYPQVMAFLKEVEVVIGDEIHHLESDQWYDRFEAIPAKWRFGLTATPRINGPGLALVAQTGEILMDIPSVNLIERGVLVPPRIWFVRCKEPKLPKKMDWREVYSQGIVNNAGRNKLLRDIATVFRADEKSCITLVKRVGHGEMLSDFFAHSGIKTQFIRGSVSQEQRDEYLEQLKEGRLHHIVAMTEIMAEGADYPWLRAIVNATGSKCGGSIKDDELGRQTIQILGRVIRKCPGKEYADYVDVSDNTHKSLMQASIERVATLEAEGFIPFVKYWSEYSVT